MQRLNRLLILFFFFCVPAAFGVERDGYGFRYVETLSDAYDAAFRVEVPGAYGSGMFIGYSDKLNKCLVLTNYHVVTNNSKGSLSHWGNDGKKETIPCVVEWRYYDKSLPADYAILGVDPSFFKERDIPFVPLAGENEKASENALLISAGCPKGSHVWAWKGGVVATGLTTEFQPAPYPGQSGSGIIEKVDGRYWYKETLTWLVGQEGSDSARGASIPVGNLYKALQSRKFPASYSETNERFVAPSNYREITDDTAKLDLAIPTNEPKQTNDAPVEDKTQDAQFVAPVFEEDFRKRPDVKESFGNVDFFEDARDFWNGRGQIAPNEGEKEDERRGGILGNSDGLFSKQLDKIEGAITEKVERIIEERTNEIKGCVRKNLFKWGLVLLLAIIVVVQGVDAVFGAIKALVKAAWKRFGFRIVCNDGGNENDKGN